MIFDAIKIFFSHRKQTIKSIPNSVLPEKYRGVPEITSDGLSSEQLKELQQLCPTSAIEVKPFSLDMGKCLFCGECEKCFPNNIHFTNQWKIWAFERKQLIVHANEKWHAPEPANPVTLLNKTIRMRQLCAGGDMGCELELGASSNVNFDMERFGMSFTASPRHAEAMVLTGPITKNMSFAAESTFSAIADPKLLILSGTDAISGGMFVDSPDIDRSFLDRHKPDLYIAGSPAHPLNIISSIASLTGRTL